MFKKIWQIIFFILLISFLVIIQFSGIHTLPGFFRDLNLFLIILVFILFFYNFKTALAAALIGALWFDIFSFNFFGFYLLAFSLTIIISEWVLKSWLTNRSFYSFLLLIFITILINNLIIGLFSYFFSINYDSSFILQSTFWIILLHQVLWGEIFGVLFFGLANTFRSHWKPVFLKDK